jgi:hypothetical protein
MLHPFAEIASFGVDDVISIPPYSTVEVPVYVDIPDEGFDGMILGSIGVLLGMTDVEIEQAGMFVNRFQRIIAVRLQEHESSIDPDFVLGDVGAEVVNFRVSIVANIRNPQPRFVMGAIISAQVHSAYASSSEPVYTVDSIRVDFAPNSFYPLVMSDAGMVLYPGVYMVRVQVEHEDTTWVFAHVLDISEELADEINEAVEIGLDEVFRIDIDSDETYEEDDVIDEDYEEPYEEPLIDPEFLATLATVVVVTAAAAMAISVVAYFAFG